MQAAKVASCVMPMLLAMCYTQYAACHEYIFYETKTGTGVNMPQQSWALVES
jgi:hypothetical protein